MGLRSKSGLLAWAAALLSAGLMLAWAARPDGAGPLTALPGPETPAGWGHPVSGGQLDLNTATAEELTALPGIGPARAAAIVAWREEHGPFRYPEELIFVNGIGESILQDILELVTVGGTANAENFSGGR